MAGREEGTCHATFHLTRRGHGDRRSRRTRRLRRVGRTTSKRRSNVVTQWNLIAIEHAGRPSGAGGRSTASLPDQHGDGSRRRLRRGQRDRAEASSAVPPQAPFREDVIEAAVATAAYMVLSNIVSTVPESIAFPARATVLQSLESQYAASPRDSRLAVQDPRGGRRERGGEGHDRCEARRRALRTVSVGTERAPGPLASACVNAAGQQILDPTPWVGGVKPFLLQSSSQFRTLGSPRPRQRRLRGGRSTRSRRSGRRRGADPDPTRRTSLSGGRATPSRAGTTSPATSSHANDLDIVDSARLLAMQNLARRTRRSTAGTTSTTTTSGGRGTRSPGRLRTATRRPRRRPTWTPLIAAPYPDTSVGPPRLDSSHTWRATDVLRRRTRQRLPDHEHLRLSPTGDATTRSFDQLLAGARRDRRGPHLGRPPLPHRRRAGQQLGTNVANYMAANYFQPVGSG